MNDVNQKPAEDCRDWRKVMVFRLAAVCLGLSPLMAAEIVFRALDWGRVTEAPDPFIGFNQVEPLFVLNESTGRYAIPPSRQEFFRPQSFPAQKAPGAFRIFCLGGSTVQGRPYANETAFPAWLSLDLQAADESRPWEVINCGGVSYASYRLAPIMEELLHYEPDLFVIYTGHNEFLEDREYAHLRSRLRWVGGVHRLMTRMRVYNVIHIAGEKAMGRNQRRPRENVDLLETEVQALLDDFGGLADYHRDDSAQKIIIEHFEHNLRRMVQLAHSTGRPVILVNPVSNLRDCPPFKAVSDTRLSEQQQRRAKELWREASDLGIEQQAKKIELLEQAVAQDGRQAGLLYDLGRAYEDAQRLEEAKRYYVRAKEEDVCPLRMLESMHDIVLRVAEETDSPLIDFRRQFNDLAVGVLPGDDLLLDHVHPKVDGHRRLGEALFHQMQEMGLVKESQGWRERRDDLHRIHHEKLPFGYFVRGQERLRGLRLWTQGRARRGVVRRANQSRSTSPTLDSSAGDSETTKP